MYQLHYENKGQVLLASVIVIGTIGLVIAGSLILLSISSLKGTIATRQSAQAVALNNACEEKALFLIKQTPSYSGSDQIILNFQTCSFTVVDLGGNNRLVTVNSIIGNVIRRTQISLTVDSNSNITIDYWREVP